MRYATKLTGVVLLTLVIMMSTAFAASIKTGNYEARHEGGSIAMMLNADGSGFIEGEGYNRLEWKQTGSELVLKIYGEEGSSEFVTEKATVLSSESFNFAGLKYTAVGDVPSQTAQQPPPPVQKVASDSPLTVTSRPDRGGYGIIITSTVDSITITNISINRGNTGIVAYLVNNKIVAADILGGTVKNEKLFPTPLKFGDEIKVGVMQKPLELTITTNQGAWTYTFK